MVVLRHGCFTDTVAAVCADAPSFVGEDFYCDSGNLEGTKKKEVSRSHSDRNNCRQGELILCTPQTMPPDHVVSEGHEGEVRAARAAEGGRHRGAPAHGGRSARAYALFRFTAITTPNPHVLAATADIVHPRSSVGLLGVHMAFDVVDTRPPKVSTSLLRAAPVRVQKLF